ncbi:solute carrier family 44 protein member 2, putative [Ichthyophthirius multifiliis]|uniref:Choline transporter-like protein n=1 Tax=Ichthyophthirius multifiliis TaxID=5932 RepID=G0QLX1_ICHMU|nr:solute carrier family 44 protein member 2, putative [Ichthyophthirius multifiliis]EGR33784.1 solute carrier family 44 protein member 2, putative [Ichthyophthirius multifiliis]|eukprot:XP_004039008.1 solute carrier family 44 protein member 2, putative [Ichthyophthirius multifiliis]
MAEGGLSAKEEEELKNGPINQRECRDILCCLLFIATLVACIVLFAYGQINGQPKRLFAVYNTAGNPCGLDYQSDRKYLYFYIPYYNGSAENYLTYTTCVKECPTKNDIEIDCDTTSMKNTEQTCHKQNCDLDVSNLMSLTSKNNLLQTVCIYETKKFLDLICMPTTQAFQAIGGSAQKQVNTFMSSGTLGDWINDLKTCQWVLVGSLGCAFVLGMLYMLFLRLFAGLIVWLCILIFFIAIIGLGYYSYKSSMDIKQYLENNSEAQNKTRDNQLSYLYLAYILWAFAGLSLFFLFCYRKKIAQAIAIIKTTTSFVTDTCSVLLVPPIVTILNGLWWVFWICGFIFLYAIDKDGNIKKSPNSIFAKPIHSEEVKKLLWAFLFIGLWVNAFIQTFCQFVSASSACIWYFSHGEEGQKHAPVSTSIYRAFRYHLGSLAFGSLLLAIVQSIRILLAYMEKQMKSAGASNNKVAKYLIKCLQCYMSCFERFIKFLNRMLIYKLHQLEKVFVWPQKMLCHQFGVMQIDICQQMELEECLFLLENFLYLELQQLQPTQFWNMLNLINQMFLQKFYLQLLFFQFLILQVLFSCLSMEWVCRLFQFASFGTKRYIKIKHLLMLLLYYKNFLIEQENK